MSIDKTEYVVYASFRDPKGQEFATMDLDNSGMDVKEAEKTIEYYNSIMDKPNKDFSFYERIRHLKAAIATFSYSGDDNLVVFMKKVSNN